MRIPGYTGLYIPAFSPVNFLTKFLLLYIMNLLDAVRGNFREY